MVEKTSSFKSVRDIKSGSLWQWAIVGGSAGYLILHPWIMIIAHLMFQRRFESPISVVDVIFTESARAFSFDMLPWGLSFAIISALAATFFGRSRQATAELRKSEQRFRELSITDDLTGLYNSRHFFSRLKAEIERTNRYRHPLSLLILDLDNFKRYNDNFGHLAGDRVLSATGDIIKKSIRSTDSAYRYGGEEFAVILPESNEPEALQFAERIRVTLKNEALYADREEKLRVTVSIGVAQYIPREEITAFIKRADQNMYTAKKAGKNRIQCSQ